MAETIDGQTETLLPYKNQYLWNLNYILLNRSTLLLSNSIFPFSIWRHVANLFKTSEYLSKYWWTRDAHQCQLTSQEHCTNQVTITLMTTLLPDQVTFYFSFEGDSYCYRKPNLFIFISAKEFSFPHFTFNLLKIFTKF